MRSLLRASRVGLWSSIAQGRTGTRTHGTMHGQDEVVVKQHPFHYRANSRPDERQGKPIAPAVAKLSRSQLVPACAFVMLSDLTTCKSAAPGCGHSLLDSRPRPQCAAPGRGHTVCSTAGRAQLARVIVPGHWSTIPGCGRRGRSCRPAAGCARVGVAHLCRRSSTLPRHFPLPASPSSSRPSRLHSDPRVHAFHN